MPPPLNKSNEYQSWSFGGRSFLVALTFSFLWHFFWFFAITIVVSPKVKHEKPRPKLVSLGPVLDDTIFKTLVESRPQLSQTFYHQLSDFSPAVEIETKIADRRLPGDVVGLPFRKRFADSLKGVLGGFKAVPDFDASPKMGLRSVEPIVRFQGSLAGRTILSPVSLPEAPEKLSPALQEAELEAEIRVDADGSVSWVTILRTTGDAALDAYWESFLKSLRFATADAESRAREESGRARLHFPRREERTLS